MKYLRKPYIPAVTAGLVITAALLLMRQKPSERQQSPTQTQSVSRHEPVTRGGPEVSVPKESVKADQRPTAGPAVPVPLEVAATRRMYAAHAPLRTASVADPDSDANREILETMVHKALRRAADSQPENRSAPSGK